MATVGKTTGWAKTPSSRSRSLNRPAVSESPIITGVIGVSERPVSKPSRVSSALKRRGVRPEPLLQLGLLLHDPDRLAAGGHDGRRMGRREEERAGALGEDLAQGLRCRPRTRRATPTAFDSVPTWMATRPCSPKWSTRPAAVPPEHARGMGVVDHDGRAVRLGRLDDPGEWRDVAVHAEDAVGHDEDQPVRRRPHRAGRSRAPRAGSRASASTSPCG